MIFTVFTESCNHHCSQLSNKFITTRNFPPVNSHPHFPHHLHWFLQPLIYFLSLLIWLCGTFHINKIIQHVVFCDWLLSYSIMFFVVVFFNDSKKIIVLRVTWSKTGFLGQGPLQGYGLFSLKRIQMGRSLPSTPFHLCRCPILHDNLPWSLQLDMISLSLKSSQAFVCTTLKAARTFHPVLYLCVVYYVHLQEKTYLC